MASGTLSKAGLLAVALVAGTGRGASGADYWFADLQAFPGAIWHAQDDAPERVVFRHQEKANPAFPRAVMKVAQLAAAPDGAFYFCSGLDGNVLALLDGRHEVLTFEFGGQIRDLSAGGEDHVVYFSVVPTPQNGEPLADGKLYRRDLWNGAPAEVATVRQADVGGNWWGLFTVREGVAFIATTEKPSRLFRLTSGKPEPVFTANDRQLAGLEADGDGFLVVDAAGRVERTTDFVTFAPVRAGGAKFSDVTVRRKP